MKLTLIFHVPKDLHNRVDKTLDPAAVAGTLRCIADQVRGGAEVGTVNTKGWTMTFEAPES